MEMTFATDFGLCIEASTYTMRRTGATRVRARVFNQNAVLPYDYALSAEENLRAAAQVIAVRMELGAVR